MPGQPGVESGAQLLRMCLDVNVFVTDFLARQRGSQGSASIRIVDAARNGARALGPVRLFVSWRMLTTLREVLRRRHFASDERARAHCDLLAATAEAEPFGVPPFLLLGGTGLLPMADQEDAGVLETAIAGKADLLVSYDLGDFEAGPRSRLATERLISDGKGRPTALLVRDPLRGDLLAASPDLAVGWLRGETVPPVSIVRT